MRSKLFVRTVYTSLVAGLVFGWSNLGFTQIAPAQYQLYSGKVYLTYPPVEQGTPNYEDLDFFYNSHVRYHGREYTAVPIKYDLILDELVILHPDKNELLIVPKPWVEEFSLGRDTFVRIDSGHPDLAPGFYRQLFSAPGHEFLAKYSKQLKDTYHLGRRVRHITSTEQFYVKSAGSDSFQNISTRGQALRLDPKNRRKNRRDLIDLGLYSKNHLEEAIVHVLTHSGRD